jgi:hypothetical protein
MNRSREWSLRKKRIGYASFPPCFHCFNLGLCSQTVFRDAHGKGRPHSDDGWILTLPAQHSQTVSLSSNHHICAKRISCNSWLNMIKRVHRFHWLKIPGFPKPFLAFVQPSHRCPHVHRDAGWCCRQASTSCLTNLNGEDANVPFSTPTNV